MYYSRHCRQPRMPVTTIEDGDLFVTEGEGGGAGEGVVGGVMIARG